MAQTLVSSTDGGARSRFGSAGGGGGGGIKNRDNLIIKYYCFALTSAVTNNITRLFIFTESSHKNVQFNTERHEISQSLKYYTYTKYGLVSVNINPQKCI